VNQREAALRHHLHKIPEAEFEAQIPSHAQDDDLSVEVSTRKQLIQTHKPGHRPALLLTEMPDGTGADKLHQSP
jgi:hypothetical protein